MTASLVTLNENTGQLLTLADPDHGRPVVAFEAGDEITLNGRPLKTRLIDHTARAGESVARLDVVDQRTYGAGYRMTLTRLVTCGGDGLHTGRPGSAHIRYHLQRVPFGDYNNSIDVIWAPPLEAPLHVETLGVLGAPSTRFGPKTRMRALAIGGSGPREHVSFEDGPVADVVPWLQTGFRSTFPGQMTIPGAMYYDPDSERYLWIITRRTHVGGRILFNTASQQFEYAYFRQLAVHDEIVTPEISLFWGQGLQNAERVLAEQFDRYEEPPAWWGKTNWFWLHPCWQRDGSLEACETAVKILSNECGTTGFGIALHDVPWSGRDIDPASLLPSPGLGGDDGLRRLTETIRSVGGHSYVWSTRTGLHPVRDRRDRWCVRGVDGRRVRLAPPESGVQLDVLNNDDPGYRQYLFDTVRHYVTALGVDGIFWDSGGQPMPPDFTDRGDDICPGESMTALTRFYDEVYRLGRSLSPDFFMWFEGISTEIRTNAFAVDNRMHGERSAHPLMHRIARVGRRRLVWRSAWTHDLASGFPFITPVNDVGSLPTEATYRRIAADPMNRAIGRIVRERGHHDAIGLADGVSQVDDLIIVSPGLPAATRFTLTAEHRGKTLQNTLDGSTRVATEHSSEATTFDQVPTGIWAIR